MPLTGTPAEFIQDIQEVFKKHDVKAIHVHEVGAMFKVETNGILTIGCRSTIEGFDTLPGDRPQLRRLK